MGLIDWDVLERGSRPWSAVVWHHSETKDGETKDWDAIRRYHIKEKGWRDIGYHFGIERVGGVLGVKIGRPLSMVGGHCLGMNEQAIGICVIGNFDLAAPDAETCRMVVSLGREISAHFRLKPAAHHYHREFTKEKNCPGLKFIPLAILRASLESGGTI